MADTVLQKVVSNLSVVFLFAGDIVRTSKPEYSEVGGWCSAERLDVDKKGPTASYERVLAAAVMYRMNQNLILVPSGGVTNTIPSDSPATSPTISSVVAHELKTLGVLPGKIVEEPQATDTCKQVLKCSKLARQRCWASNKICILAPSWQIPRISTMLEKMGEEVSPFSGSRTAVIPMERVLIHDDPDRWLKYFDELYARASFQGVFQSELLGVAQLHSGYRPGYSCPRPYRGFQDPLDK